MDTKTYNKLLKYVYFEGYADSYEDAEQLIEEVDDEQFDALYEEFVLNEATESILEHLVSEGFADDKESASAILSVMSDEWLDQIIESSKELKTKVGRERLETLRARLKDFEKEHGPIGPHSYYGMPKIKGNQTLGTKPTEQKTRTTKMSNVRIG